MLTLLILTSTLTLSLSIKPVVAWTGTIYIRADGSIDPPTAPIQRDGDIYILTDNITTDGSGIIIERDGITLDGANYTIQGKRVSWSHGIVIEANAVTVKNIKIKCFYAGIGLTMVLNNCITKCDITLNVYGILLTESSNNSIIGNNITGSKWSGIHAAGSCFNTITGNIIEKNCIGIHLLRSSGNSLYANNITANEAEGIWIALSKTNSIVKNIIKGNGHGIFLDGSESLANNVVRNNIENNSVGIWVRFSRLNNIIENNIENNRLGIEHCVSSENYIFHNNFVDNVQQVLDFSWIAEAYPSNNTWDDGYPSGGNYWSDYVGIDEKSGPNQDQPGSDGIWDHPYVIDENNRDRYPLVNPWTPATPIQTWVFDSDFQYNLDDDYRTVEGTGHLAGKATLSDGTLSVEGQITISGPLPSTIPEVYLVATDGPDKELAKQAVDLTGFSYWQTGPNTYNFTGQIPNVIQPINNGHYEIQALITYDAAKYEFFVDTTSLINSHYFPLTSPPPKFRIGDWVQTTANLNVREGPGLSYAIISTMPTGTMGRIVGGPLEVDGYVWWNVDYVVDYVFVVRGWSAENWLELYPLPICIVKLQKDGVEINEINICEFFDIYVGDSSGDKPIKAVRFSSDDIQDGIPTGEWTEWYDWDFSSADWNAITKIKRWAFATPGYKEVWAEVKDEAGHAAAGFAKIFVPAPALPVITSPLVITPTKDIYDVGDVLEAKFIIKNVGDKPITLDKLLVGGRFNGGKLPNGEFPDFTCQTYITLQPGQSHQYEGSLTLTQTGNYHFFVAYYIENPSPEEKTLLDENNWNTNIALGEGLTHKDRVKNVIVLEKVDLLKLEEAINRWEKVLTTYQYPPNLLDDKSFTGRVSKVWASFTSFITRTQLTEKYKELYSTGVEYHRLSYQALMEAKNCLEKGDVEGAGKYLQRSYTYGRLSGMSFSSAAEVYEASLEAGEILARGIKEGCEATVKVGVSILYPPAATKVDAAYAAFDWVIDTMIEGWNQSTKNLITKIFTGIILKKWVFTSFDHKTFEDYANLIRAKVPLDEILTNEEFLEELGCEQLYKAIYGKLLNEVRIELTLPVFKKIIEGVVERFISFAGSIRLKGKSPIELRVIDQEGRITGVVNGAVKHEIPMSFYYNGTIIIYFLAGSYLYEVAGIEEGYYSLEITFTKEGTSTTFKATNIPTSQSALHQYAVDWPALFMGEEGVTVQVDSNGDGVFEHIFTSDNELNNDEFILQTATTIDIDPDTLNLKSKGKWITAYIELPEGYGVGDIDISSILLNGTIPVDPNAPTAVGDYDGDGVADLMVKFNRTAVCEFILSKGITVGNVTLTVSGRLYDGTEFEGCDTIRVRMPGDINMDGKVDMKDISILCRAFGSYPGHSRWNPTADENEDNKIDIFDIALTCRNYGKTYK